MLRKLEINYLKKRFNNNLAEGALPMYFWYMDASEPECHERSSCEICTISGWFWRSPPPPCQNQAEIVQIFASTDFTYYICSIIFAYYIFPLLLDGD